MPKWMSFKLFKESSRVSDICVCFYFFLKASVKICVCMRETEGYQGFIDRL